MMERRRAEKAAAGSSGLDEMACAEPLPATAEMPPEIAEMLKPQSGIFIRSEYKPTVDLALEQASAAGDIWRVLDHGADYEIRTTIPGVDRIELQPEEAADFVVDASSIQSYRPPWLEQHFLPRLTPFRLSGPQVDRNDRARVFFEPTASEQALRLQYPWCTVGFLEVNSAFGVWYGSGVLVGPNLVLTAGHLMPWNDGATTWSMEFTPAFRRNDPISPVPYGRSFVETFRGFRPPDPIQPTGYDYALLKLVQPLGNALGWMGVQWSQNENWYLGRDHNSSGYPGTFNGRQAVQYGLRIDDIDNDLPGIELETTRYASGGWSGGPLWYYDGANPMIVGTVSGAEKDGLDPERDVHSGYQALVELVQFGLDNWQP